MNPKVFKLYQGLDQVKQVEHSSIVKEIIIIVKLLSYINDLLHNPKNNILYLKN